MPFAASEVSRNSEKRPTRAVRAADALRGADAALENRPLCTSDEVGRPAGRPLPPAPADPDSAESDS